MARRHRRGRGLLITIVVLALAMSLHASASTLAAGSDADRSAAWLDTPLNASQWEPGPVSVLAHATDAGGVTAIRLLVDGAAVEEDTGLSGTLAQAAFAPDFLTKGLHTLSVVGIGANGEVESEPVSIEITVIAPEETPTPAAGTPTAEPPPAPTATARATPTPAPTAEATRTATPTSRPTTTPAPTPTPCVLTAPSVVSPSGSALVNSTSITFTWSYRGECIPAAFVVQVAFDRSYVPVDASAVVGGGQTSVTVAVPCVVGTWQWRVAASTATNGAAPGPWSGDGVFNRSICRAG
jgi:hypothetical protein